MEKDVGRMRFADQTTPEKKHAYIQKHVYLRMLYLMAGQEARAVTAIPDIPAADQEFWQQTLWAMSNYFDIESMPQDDYRATQTIAQLRTAIQKLQENARLELRNVAFCHKISSFGNFDRFPRDEFGPGQPVLVYAEVANFKSTPTTLPNKPNETAYRTQLKSSIEIHRLGPNGELVERFDFEPTEDLLPQPPPGLFSQLRVHDPAANLPGTARDDLDRGRPTQPQGRHLQPELHGAISRTKLAVRSAIERLHSVLLRSPRSEGLQSLKTHHLREPSPGSLRIHAGIAPSEKHRTFPTREPVHSRRRQQPRPRLRSRRPRAAGHRTRPRGRICTIWTATNCWITSARGGRTSWDIAIRR